jgi:hypothetical protein
LKNSLFNGCKNKTFGKYLAHISHSFKCLL